MAATLFRGCWQRSVNKRNHYKLIVGFMTVKRPILPLDQKPNHLLTRLGELRSELRLRSPEDIAARTGAVFKKSEPDGGNLTISVWDQDLVLGFPELTARSVSTGQDVGAAIQALVLYYFIYADGTPLTGRYIAYSELPDGRFYSQAFQGYTGHELARRFADDLEALRKVAGKLGGIPQSLGDCSYSFQLFPNVTLMIVYWLGDEDFPSNCQILFDEATASQLPTDACAIAGSMLTRNLLTSA
jgi:hypothetical protein